MAASVTIPLNIKGLKEAKDKLAQINKEWRELSGSTQDYVKKRNALEKSFYAQRDAIDAATDSMIELKDAGELGAASFDDLNEVLLGSREEIVPLNEQVREMEKRLNQLAAAGEQGSQEFHHLVEESARLKTIMIDTKQEVNSLVDDEGLGGLSHAFGAIGESMAHLNFDEAAEHAEHFSHQMHDLGKNAKGGMKSLAKTVGTVSKAFLKMGLSLLMNPLFLLVAVVAGIVTAFVMLKDKVAFLGEIFDFIAKPIMWVIQLFKDLLDWIGLTSFAEDEAAAERAKEAEARKAQMLQQRRQIQLNKDALKRAHESEQSAFDTQIKLYQAQGKDVTELTRAKINGSIAYKKALLSEMETHIKAMESLAHLKDSQSTLVAAFGAGSEQTASDTKTVFEELKSEIESLEVDLEIVDIDAGKKAKEQGEKVMEAARRIQDLEIELMADGLAKELELLNVQFDREIEATLANENLKQTQKDKLIALFNKQRKAAEVEARANEALEQAERDAEKEKAELDKLNKRLSLEDQAASVRKAQRDLANELEASEEEKELTALRQSYAAKFEIAKGNFDLQIALKKDLIAAEEKLEADQADRAKKLKQTEITAKTQIAINGLQMVAGIAELFADRNEKAARVAFNIQKAAAIAQATMDGYKAVLSTLADTPGGPVIKGIAAGITGGMAAVQIANIAKSKFEGGGGGSMAVSAPSSGGFGGGGATGSTSSGPSFELFGQPNDFNNVQSPDSAEQTINVNAIVSETEITETQNTISNIQQSSEL